MADNVGDGREVSACERISSPLSWIFVAITSAFVGFARFAVSSLTVAVALVSRWYR